MRIFCTYCSASKDPSTGLVPAYKRYISDRIIHVHQLAEAEKVLFCILSGKFGLVDWNEPLPLYDHLLLPEEVPQLVEKVSRQLSEKGTTHVHYFTKSPSEDPQLWPYIRTIEQACKKARVHLEGTTLVEPALSSPLLSWKQIMELAAEAGQKLKIDRKAGEGEFEKLLSVYPKDGMVYFQRGVAYESIKEFALAKSDYKVAKQYFPLDRWQWEAQNALDRLVEKTAEGGTLSEARRHINHLERIDAFLKQKTLDALAHPASAANKIRTCLEIFLKKLPKIYYRYQESTPPLSWIQNLNRELVPEIIISHMNTIKHVGGPGSHDTPRLELIDIFPSITAFVAVLEWWEEELSKSIRED